MSDVTGGQVRLVKGSDTPMANTFMGTLHTYDADGNPLDPNGANDLVTTGSAIGTVGKTTTSAEPNAGSIVPVLFTNGNSASSPTLAFDGGAARAIQLGGTASTGAKLAVAANGVALFYFDGTVLHQIGAYT